MRVLVTGGAGFIGSHVTDLLCNHNYEVTVVDDLRFGYKKFVNKRAKFLHFSLEDSRKIKSPYGS